MKRCTECSREMRPLKTSREAYPGTIAPGARGMCNVCYTKWLNYGGLASEAVATEERDVLTRVYLTSSTYKTLRRAGVDTNFVLSKLADKLAEKVKKSA